MADMETKINAPTGAVMSGSSSKSNKMMLDTDEFFQLLAAQLQNQDVMNPMSQTDMVNQMVQMATIQAMNTMMDVSTTSYAASLVGKEVTIADISDDGSIKEVVGTVTGSGLYGGEQVIFVNDNTYYLTQIMAVGKIPEAKDEGNNGNEGDGNNENTTPPPSGA